MSKITTIINGLLRRSHWYTDILFPNCKKFLIGQRFNQELVNLGSTTALSAFNYDGLGICAANWAMASQSFVNDYAILTNYSSYLKKGATVLITLCPFSSFGGGNEYFADYYYSVVRPISIPNASLRKRNEVRAMQINPLRYYTFWGFFYDIKCIFNKKQKQLSAEEMKNDAKVWINNWKKEFSIFSLDDDLSLINQDRFNDSKEALNEIVSFCKTHSFRPVVILPPVSQYLSKMLPANAREAYINGFMKSVVEDGVLFLNYLDDPDFLEDDLFLNANILNSRGARVFTKRVLRDIQS